MTYTNDGNSRKRLRGHVERLGRVQARVEISNVRECELTDLRTFPFIGVLIITSTNKCESLVASGVKVGDRSPAE